MKLLHENGRCRFYGYENNGKWFGKITVRISTVYIGIGEVITDTEAECHRKLQEIYFEWF